MEIALVEAASALILELCLRLSRAHRILLLMGSSLAPALKMSIKGCTDMLLEIPTSEELLQ